MPARAVLLAVALIGTANAAPGPWQRTESREPCAATSVLRNPYFGDLHIHTGFSADAYIYGMRGTPRDAYTFAQGGEILISDENEAPTRPVRIDRPIDFAAVTDHAEWYGEVRVCLTTDSPAYDAELCQLLRRVDPPDQHFAVQIPWQVGAGVPNQPRLAFCTTPGVDCAAEAVSVWQDIQAAAEEAYDRTAACAFTSFIGYEHTASPLGSHLHRNVIFRNERVSASAKGALETGVLKEVAPQGVWSSVETDCLNAGTGCDAIIIPHNPNLSGGDQWLDPADAAEAQRRQTLEPLAEIHQVKSNSECRFDRVAGLGLDNTDELCTFEQEPRADQLPGVAPPPIEQYPRRNMIRNTLKDGLALEQQLGVNPFRLGFTGSTDTHNGTAGNTAEASWPGIEGNHEATAARQIADNIRNNPGGLTAVWAEENSRDALFDALRRRETFATSGTRPVVRFFGGDLSGVTCGSPTLARDAYATGTPMGGELGAVRGKKSPRFVVWATKDPGTETTPGTDLQRIQIIKGWVDADGQTHEQMFDVAGSADNGAGVDASCNPTGSGAAELCAEWRDPAFDRRQRAFYYARVLENPTCRWSTVVCKAAGVEPLAADCPAQAAAAGPSFANCCLGRGNDPFMDPLIQERAWTSPIWYRPEGVGRLSGKVRFGKSAGRDVLVLQLQLGTMPDVAQHGLTVRIADDDEIYAATIPAGGLRARTAGIQALGRGAQVPGLKKLSLARRGKGALLRLVTRPLDLAVADRTEHMVTVSLESGTWRTSVARLWSMRRDALVPGAR